MLRIVLLAFCLGTFALTAKATVPIRVQLEWKYQFEFAGFIVAKELGFYDEIGLDVDLIEYQPSVDNIQLLLRGQADYVVHNSNLVVHGGHIAPVVVLATYFQRSPLILVAHPSIKTPRDLLGKRLMGTTDEFAYSSLALLLNHFYVNETNSTILEHTFDIESFVSGRVDAMSAFRSNQLYELDRMGVPYNVIDPADYGFLSNAVSVLATRESVVANPEQHKAFVDATNRGWQYALANVDQTIELIYDRYSQLKTKEALRYEAEVTRQMMQLDLFPLGATSDELGQRTFRQLKRSGLLADEETYQQLSLDSLLAKLDIEFQMTPSQREFLFDKGELVACVSADQLPLEAMSGGKYVGIIADLISQAFARDLPIPLSVHALESEETWQNDLSNGHCDFRTMVVPSGEDPRFSFTEDFFQQPLVMATTTDTLFVNDLYRLGRRKIGVTNQPSVIAELQKSYPEIEFIAYDGVQQALSKVVGGDLFGYIDEASTVANEIQRTYPSALKIGATLEQEIGFAMAVSADQPELLKVLNTLALRIGGDELSVQNAYNNWISVRSETAFDYRLFWQVVGVIAVIALVLFINNLRLRKMGLELHRASITDALTGVGNRLRADQLLSQHYREARTGAAQPLGILLCDIDHFKLINDRFGHQVGDEALKYFAKTVSECLPANASLCRWGGEEFLVLLPGFDATVVRSMAETVRGKVADKAFKPGIELRASFGAGVLDAGLSLDKNLTLIDNALYAAKERGRDQVVMVGD